MIKRTNDPIPFIGIIGPTAVGKTRWSLKIAERLRGEIISVDSRQVYRYLDVGADKIDAVTRKRIPHHLLDVVDPDQPFSAADFVLLASKAIEVIRNRGKVPLLVGGTPFYFKALTEEILSEDLPQSWEVRKALEHKGETLGRDVLHQELFRIDPVYASRIHPNDLYRVVRGLELYELCRIPPTILFQSRKKQASPFKPLYIGLWRESQELATVISRRVREQFSSGFVEEVRELLHKGYDPELPALQGFGYRELVWYHRGRCPLDEALQGDIKATRAFSRRQMTWFRNFVPALWYHVSRLEEEAVFSKLVERCENFLHKGKGP